MRHTIAIEQLLFWNLAGIFSIIHFDHSCLKSAFSSYGHWILCSFKQAEADCDQALLLDKKVSDFLLVPRTCWSLHITTVFCCYIRDSQSYLFNDVASECQSISKTRCRKRRGFESPRSTTRCGNFLACSLLLLIYLIENVDLSWYSCWSTINRTQWKLDKALLVLLSFRGKSKSWVILS
jgi:hypothetical protein